MRVLQQSGNSTALHPKQNERAIDKTKALMSKRKPSYRFVMHPPGKVGAFSLCDFSEIFYLGDSGEGSWLESFVFSGAFAVLH